MGKLQPFLIAELKTGLSSYLEPWLRPNDAFEPLINAYTYRGTLNKRNGTKLFGTRLADHNPVMGIMNRIDESTGDVSLVVASTTNVYLLVGTTFTPQVTVGGANSIFWKGTATGTIVIPTFWPKIVPATVSITDGTSTLTFDAAGNMNSAPAGIFAALSTFVFATGVATIIFAGATAGVSLTLSATLVTPTPGVGAVFTGNNTNFFNWTNWQPTDPVTGANSISYLYMTNNVDPVTTFDGTNLARPILYTNAAFTDYLVRALDVQVFQNRLLLIRPNLFTGTVNELNQTIYYSALFNPLNFVNDVAGNGGQVTAATGDLIQCQEFLRNNMIVFFSNSVWNFRFTGSASDPFRFDKISISKSTNAPYASVAYDERCTSIGNLGLIACDGTNVQRYDIPIIDYYETEFSELYYGQAFSQRYDNLNQTWTLYVSNEADPSIYPVVGGGAPGSDKALIYNFLENSWATYTFATPMSCLGRFRASSGATWASLNVSPDDEWENQDVPWNSYGNQAKAPILLGGDTVGNVFWMDNVQEGTDNGTAFDVNVTTTRWNPVLATGEKTQFPYIDIYYSVVSTDPTTPISLTLSFFVDNSENWAAQRTFTLDGPPSSGFAFKRVYVNLVGEFIQMNIDPVENASFKILGFILWASSAGRLTPGSTV